jgi:hypothetical protein
MASGGVDVFICHAGEQKKDFVDTVRTLLKDVHKLNVFLDEHSLLIGDHARDKMHEGLESAFVGKYSRCSYSTGSSFLQ